MKRLFTVIKDYLESHSFEKKAGQTVIYENPSAYVEELIEHGYLKELESVDNNFDAWNDNAIKSELAKVLIAPVDYAEDDKKHFTWEEACEIYGKLDNGWRLPTRHEWAMICEEFGQKDGRLDSKTLMKNLGLGANGGDWHDSDGVCGAGYFGLYWSSTPVSNGSNAYYLRFRGTGYINPSTSWGRQYGFSVRLVKDLGEV